jgi:hypothetical protein
MDYNYNKQFRGKEIALKLLLLKDEMDKLEQECKQTDDSFAIGSMYNYMVCGGNSWLGLHLPVNLMK